MVRMEEKRLTHFQLRALEQHAPRYLGPLVLLSVDGRSWLAFYADGVSSLKEQERLDKVRLEEERLAYF